MPEFDFNQIAPPDKRDFVRRRPGLLEEGNYKGDFKDMRSFEFTEDGIRKETILPVLEEGEDDEAVIERFKGKREHLGQFDTPDFAISRMEEIRNERAGTGAADGAGAPEFQFDAIETPTVPDRKALLQKYTSDLKTWAQGGGKGPRPIHPDDPKAVTARLKAAGVSTEGAPASVRSLVSLAPERLQGKALQRMLAKHYKKPVKLREGERGAEYSIDGGKSWTIVNPPGLEMGDVAGLRGTATGAIGSVIAPFAASYAMPGGVQAKAAAGVIGGALGTLFGEMGRFEIAKQNGVIPEDVSDAELLGDAAIAAGIDLGGGMLATGVLKLWRLYKARGTGALRNLDVKQLEEDIKAAQGKADEITKESGQKFPVTVGQSMRPGEARDVVLSVEEKVQREQPQGKLAGVEAQQRTAQRALESNIQAEAPPPSRPVQQIGEGVRDVMGAEPRAELMTQEAIVAARQAELDRVAQAAVSGNLTPIDAGRITRDNWSDGKRAIQNAFGDRYDQMAEKHGGIAISTVGLRRAAIRHKKVLDADLMPSLAPDDRTLIKDVLNSTAKNKTVSLGTAQRALSSLREELRDMRKGVSSRKGIKEVQELHDAIENARNAAIERVGPNSTSPVRLKEVLKLERDYARAKDMIDRSALGSLLRTKEGGGWVVPDDEVISKTLSSESGMREIVSALRDPAYAQHLGGERTLKQGIYGLYEREVMRDGKINVAAHNRFMGKYEDALRVTMSPDEMKRLQAPGGAAKMLKEEEEKLTELKRYAERSLGMRMQEWDASAVVKQLWNPTGLERLNATMAKVRSVDPALADDLKGAIAREIRLDISDYDTATGEFLPSPKKLAERLNDATWAEAVKDTFGAHYLRALKVLQDAQVFANATPVKRAQGGPMEAVWKPYRNVMAILSRVTIARPLSAAGVAQTGALRRKTAWQEARLDRLLSDPQAMVDLLKIRRLSPFSAAGATAMADLARRVEAYDVDLETGESAEGQ